MGKIDERRIFKSVSGYTGYRPSKKEPKEQIIKKSTMIPKRLL